MSKLLFATRYIIIICFVSDALVRQAAMIIKCNILMYYKNSRGRKYRKQVRQCTLKTKDQKIFMLVSPHNKNKIL